MVLHCPFYTLYNNYQSLAESAAAAAAAKSLQSCLTLCDPIDGSPPDFPAPGILQARMNTGVGCHFLLQCMKVKEECEKVGLNFNIQKTKIMASSPITSWQIDRETVADFNF